MRLFGFQRIDHSFLCGGCLHIYSRFHLCNNRRPKNCVRFIHNGINQPSLFDVFCFWLGFLSTSKQYDRHSSVSYSVLVFLVLDDATSSIANMRCSVILCGSILDLGAKDHKRPSVSSRNVRALRRRCCLKACWSVWFVDATQVPSDAY
jgi:hypothetical protein